MAEVQNFYNSILIMKEISEGKMILISLKTYSSILLIAIQQAKKLLTLALSNIVLWTFGI